MPQQLWGVWLNNDLCLKISPGAVAEVFVILPGKAIRAAVDAAAITIDRITPAAFPVGSEGLGNHLFGGGFLEDLQLGRRRFANIFGRVFVVGIWRIGNLSHRCNSTACADEKQDLATEVTEVTEVTE